MAVGFDAAVEVERIATTDPQTWTHVPAGTPKGILVTIAHGTESTDLVAGVTYNGVAMTRVLSVADTATEPGRAYLYFLGTSIPSGNQTVSVDFTSATATDVHLVSISVTANGDTEVLDSDSLAENQANPSVTLQYQGRTCMSFAVLYGGGASPASFTPNGNCTAVHDFDIAAFYSTVIRQTTAGTADFAIGGTAATDDVAYVAAAVSEISRSTTPLVGSLVGSGVGGILGYAVSTVAGVLAATGLAATLILGTVTPVTPVAGILFFGLEEATSPSLTPAAGSLIFSGLAPPVVQDVRLSPTAGTLALTSNAPTLVQGTLGTPLVGTLTVTGGTPALLQDSIRGPPVGSLAFTGVAATFDRGLVSSAGSLAASGTSPGLNLGISSSLGVLTLAGAAPILQEGSAGIITPSAGALAVSGAAPTQNLAVLGTAGFLTLAGIAPAPIQGTPQTPAVGTLALSGISASLLHDGRITPPAGSLALAGVAPTLAYGLTPSVGSLALAGATPTLRTATQVTPSGAVLTATGASSALNFSILPAVGSVIGAGSAPIAGHGIVPTAGIVTVSGLAPSLLHDARLTPVVGVLSLVGAAPTVQISGQGQNTNITPGEGFIYLGLLVETQITVPVATHSLTSFAPVIGVSPVAVPLTGALSITPATPVVSTDRTAQPSGGAVALVGAAPTVVEPTSMQRTPAAGALALTGYAPSVSIGTVIGPNTDLAPGTGQLFFGVGDFVRSTAAGSLVLAGNSPFVDRIGSPQVTPVVGVLTVTGQNAGLSQILNVSITPGTGQLKLDRNPTPGSGFLALLAAAPSLDLRLFPQGGALILASDPPRLNFIAPAPASLSLTGNAPAPLAFGIIPSAGTLIITGAFAQSDTRPQPGSATLGIATTAPTLALSIAPPGTTLMLTGAAPSFAGLAIPSTGTVSLVGFAPSPRIDVRLTVGTGSLVHAGVSPGLSYQVFPGSGALALVAAAPIRRVETFLVPGSGSLAVIGGPAALFHGALVPSPAILALTSSAPTVQLSGVILPEIDVASVVFLGAEHTVRFLGKTQTVKNLNPERTVEEL